MLGQLTIARSRQGLNPWLARHEVQNDPKP